MRTRKKLIEVALPLDAINAAAAREKSIRHGHPSTLHLWWARRPLAKIRRSVSAVSMATSEYCSCPPRLPTPTASHVAIASGVNHRVTSPRWTSARSYAGQFPTRYVVVYLGCTLDFTSRSCPFGRHDGQGRDEHLFPRTNALK